MKNTQFPGCGSVKVWILKRDSNTAYTAPRGLQTRKRLRLVPCAHLYGVARLAWASLAQASEAHRCKWLGRF
eukprot:328603-Chlamydomonas_euryale.AAC.1